MENEETPLSPGEVRLLRQFRRLKRVDQAAALQVIDTMAQRSGKRAKAAKVRARTEVQGAE